MSSLRIPVATYRVQLTPSFGFTAARRIVPYLHRLGISDLYCSPIMAARPGSQHGYDVTDASRLNPELGAQQEFDELVAELQRHGMGLLLDIVPNHMAASTDNPWWNDVLENGRASAFAHYFDIEWDSAMAGGILQDRVLLPILGGPYGEVLEAGELRLVLDDEGLRLAYYETLLPVALDSYADVMSIALDRLRAALREDQATLDAYQEIIQAIRRLPPPNAADPGGVAERRRVSAWAKKRLDSLLHTSQPVREHLAATINEINGQPGNAQSFTLLDTIISNQAYRLAYWQLARERINYRRFFDINDLISMRVEDQDVFEATHQLVLELARSGKVTGLRIDHIDGLHDPELYLARLNQSIAGPSGGGDGGCRGFYVVAEKILAHGEELPADWQVCGTTGYDFLNDVGGLYLQSGNADTLDATYREVTGLNTDFPQLAYEKKRRVLRDLFEAPVQSLTLWLDQISEHDRHGRDITLDTLREALVEVTACLPVYRTYIRSAEVAERDRVFIETAIGEARRRNPNLAHGLRFLRRLLLLEFPGYLPDDERRNWRSFVMRWQQFTGPVMAKGYEDTALYVYNRLLSQNEVGGHPELPGVSVAEFHRRNLEMARRWPHTLNATSTHDTKRSEDLRARLQPLSEIAEEWDQRLRHWRDLNGAKRPIVNGEPVPDPNVELLVYQTLLGVWPLPGEPADDLEARLLAYLEKAAREAKLHTSWGAPNQEYEEALAAFARKLLDPVISAEFLDDFGRFQPRLAYWGMLNSLSQTLLKMTVPGVPDFYQGTELWSLALVDPDNRRPVDYGRRDRLASELTSERPRADLHAAVLEKWYDGRIKLYLIQQTLGLRQARSELFARGDYLLLEVAGTRAEHLVAFARRLGPSWCIVVAPRLLASLVPDLQPPTGESTWGDTRVLLPDGAPIAWHSHFEDEPLAIYDDAGRPSLLAQYLLRTFPCGLASNVECD